MTCLSKRGNIGVAIAALAGFWLSTAPAIAQTSNESASATVTKDAIETDRAEQPCDCPCGAVSEAKEEETRVIYVGPRQNIPMKVKRKKSEEKADNDQEALEPQS